MAKRFNYQPHQRKEAQEEEEEKKQQGQLASVTYDINSHPTRDNYNFIPYTLPPSRTHDRDPLSRVDYMRIEHQAILPPMNPHFLEKCRETFKFIKTPEDIASEAAQSMKYFVFYQPLHGETSLNSQKLLYPFVSFATIQAKLDKNAYEKVEDFIDELRRFWWNTFRHYRNVPDTEVMFRRAATCYEYTSHRIDMLVRWMNVYEGTVEQNKIQTAAKAVHQPTSDISREPVGTKFKEQSALHDLMFTNTAEARAIEEVRERQKKNPPKLSPGIVGVGSSSTSPIIVASRPAPPLPSLLNKPLDSQPSSPQHQPQLSQLSHFHPPPPQYNISNDVVPMEICNDQEAIEVTTSIPCEEQNGPEIQQKVEVVGESNTQQLSASDEKEQLEVRNESEREAANDSSIIETITDLTVISLQPNESVLVEPTPLPPQPLLATTAAQSITKASSGPVQEANNIAISPEVVHFDQTLTAPQSALASEERDQKEVPQIDLTDNQEEVSSPTPRASTPSMPAVIELLPSLASAPQQHQQHDDTASAHDSIAPSRQRTSEDTCIVMDKDVSMRNIDELNAAVAAQQAAMTTCTQGEDKVDGASTTSSISAVRLSESHVPTPSAAVAAEPSVDRPDTSTPTLPTELPPQPQHQSVDGASLTSPVIPQTTDITSQSQSPAWPLTPPESSTNNELRIKSSKQPSKSKSRVKSKRNRKKSKEMQIQAEAPIHSSVNAPSFAASYLNSYSESTEVNPNEKESKQVSIKSSSSNRESSLITSKQHEAKQLEATLPAVETTILTETSRIELLTQPPFEGRKQQDSMTEDSAKTDTEMTDALPLVQAKETIHTDDTKEDGVMNEEDEMNQQLEEESAVVGMTDGERLMSDGITQMPSTAPSSATSDVPPAIAAVAAINEPEVVLTSASTAEAESSDIAHPTPALADASATELSTSTIPTPKPSNISRPQKKSKKPRGRSLKQKEPKKQILEEEVKSEAMEDILTPTSSSQPSRFAVTSFVAPPRTSIPVDPNEEDSKAAAESATAAPSTQANDAQANGNATPIIPSLQQESVLAPLTTAAVPPTVSTTSTPAVVSLQSNDDVLASSPLLIISYPSSTATISPSSSGFSTPTSSSASSKKNCRTQNNDFTANLLPARTSSRKRVTADASPIAFIASVRVKDEISIESAFATATAPSTQHQHREEEQEATKMRNEESPLSNLSSSTSPSSAASTPSLVSVASTLSLPSVSSPASSPSRPRRYAAMQCDSDRAAMLNPPKLSRPAKTKQSKKKQSRKRPQTINEGKEEEGKEEEEEKEEDGEEEGEEEEMESKKKKQKREDAATPTPTLVASPSTTLTSLPSSTVTSPLVHVSPPQALVPSVAPPLHTGPTPAQLRASANSFNDWVDLPSFDHTSTRRNTRAAIQAEKAIDTEKKKKEMQKHKLRKGWAYEAI